MKTVAADETVKTILQQAINGINNLGKTRHLVCPHIRDREKFCTPHFAYLQEGKRAERFRPPPPLAATERGLCPSFTERQ